MKKQIVTKSGFKCTADSDSLDDIRLLELLGELDNAPWNYGKAVAMILGDSGKEKLYKHVAEKDGRIPLSKLDIELTEIMEGLAGDEDTAKK